MSPFQAMYHTKTEDLFRKQYKRPHFKFDREHLQGQNDLKINQPVRIVTSKAALLKSTKLENYSKEIFYVERIFSRYNQLIYYLRDKAGESILGSFVRQELLPVNLWRTN